MSALPKLAFDYRMEDFQRFVGEDLEFHTIPEPVKVRLDGIRPKGGPAFLTREGFSLDFSTDKSVQLVRGIYQVRASPTEVYSLYVEPIVSLGQRQLYQALFF